MIYCENITNIVFLFLSIVSHFITVKFKKYLVETWKYT